MNLKCKEVGATQSNFVNPNGLHADDHYTTIYDLYLIFNACIQNEEFVKIIHTPSFQSNYKDKTGNPVEALYKTTNLFLSGEETVVEGITIIGGNKGTTNDAGKCLILLSQNSNGNNQISIVMKAGSKELLFQYMGKMMEEFSN